jgi:hypothetical protein
MKKVILIFTIFFLTTTFSIGQTFIFYRIGPRIVHDSISAMYPTIVKGVLKNTSATTQNFKLVRTLMSLPTGWQQNVCTYLNCFGPEADTIPPNGSGNYPLSAGQVDTITFDFYGPTEGLGTVVFRAYIVSNPSSFQFDTFAVQKGPIGIKPISSVVSGYELSQNYPNPFNPTTSINFSLAKNSEVNLVVYDMQGREVARLLNNSSLSQGSYKYDFNADDYKLSSGAYFYKLITNDFISTKKMLLIK